MSSGHGFRRAENGTEKQGLESWRVELRLATAVRRAWLRPALLLLLAGLASIILRFGVSFAAQTSTAEQLWIYRNLGKAC